MKKILPILRDVVVAVLKFPLVFLISIFSIPEIMLMLLAGISSMALFTYQGILLFIEGGGLNILGGIGSILLGIVIFMIAFSSVFGDSDSKYSFIGVWDVLIPEKYQA